MIRSQALQLAASGTFSALVSAEGELVVAGLRLELGLSGSHVQVVDQAVAELGLPRSCGSGLVERARASVSYTHLTLPTDREG